MKKSVYNFLSALVLLNLMIGFTFAGTTGKIRGTVTDMKTGEPVAGANVIIRGTSLGAATDLDGIFFILLVPPGLYTLEASMVGYNSQIKERVNVETDRTITVNFQMEEAILETETVVVTASRDLVRRDVSASETTIPGTAVETIPFAKRVEDIIGLQAGVTGSLVEGEILIREGDASETNVLVDGYSTRDTKFAKVKFPVNQQSIEEVKVLRGGYNAEYGESRSGVINIVTKNPEDKLHVSLDYRFEPPGRRHDGRDRYDRASVWQYRLYDGANSNDPSYIVRYEGINADTIRWMGWNAYSNILLNDGNPNNDLTAEEAHALWNWRHRPISYGNLSGNNIDLSVSGGIKLLPWDINILTGFKYENRPYTYPQPQDSYEESVYSLKMINKFSDNTNLTLTALHSNVNTVSRDRANSNWSNEIRLSYDGGDAEWFYPYRKPWVKTNSTLIGLKLLHIMTPTRYLESDISFYGSYWDSDKYDQSPAANGRYFHGRLYYDPESGYIPVDLGVKDDVSNFPMFGGASAWDNSFSERYNVKVSLVDQFHPSHELKTGIEFRYSKLVEDRTHFHDDDPAQRFDWRYDVSPIEFSAYIQDKIEFWGMIANLGLRWDYYSANKALPDVDSVLAFDSNEAIFNALISGTMPLRKPDPRYYFSPRVGISFPISENSKVYFNYGHFVQIPVTEAMYSNAAEYALPRVQWLGNAFLDFQKSINFELGYDQNILDWFEFHIGAFYKDYSDVQSGIVYAHTDLTLINESAVQREYRDVRGLDIEVRRSIGRFINGFLNFNITQKSVSDLQVPSVDSDIPIITDNPSFGINGELRGIPRPVQDEITPYGRGVITLSSPENWGPKIWDYPILHKTSASFALYYRGAQLTEHPDEEFRIQHPDVKFYLIPYFSSNLRLSRNFSVMKNLNFELYLDISNLWVSKYRTAIPNRSDYYNDLYANGKTDKVGSEEVSNQKILRTESDVLYAGQHRTFILGLRIRI